MLLDTIGLSTDVDHEERTYECSACKHSPLEIRLTFDIMSENFMMGRSPSCVLDSAPHMGRSTARVEDSADRRTALAEVRAQRGFSPVDLLNLWEPTGAWEEYPGLTYGEGPRQNLDVYKPRHAVKAPVVVFFYGGSWQAGSRDIYPFFGASLAAHGILTVVPDYSIFPPACLSEVIALAPKPSVQ